MAEAESTVRRDLLEVAALSGREEFADANRRLIETHTADRVLDVARDLEYERLTDWPTRADPMTLEATAAGLAELERIRDA